MSDTLCSSMIYGIEVKRSFLFATFFIFEQDNKTPQSVHYLFERILSCCDTKSSSSKIKCNKKWTCVLPPPGSQITAALMCLFRQEIGNVNVWVWRKLGGGGLWQHCKFSHKSIIEIIVSHYVVRWWWWQLLTIYYDLSLFDENETIWDSAHRRSFEVCCGFWKGYHQGSTIFISICFILCFWSLIRPILVQQLFEKLNQKCHKLPPPNYSFCPPSPQNL